MNEKTVKPGEDYTSYNDDNAYIIPRIHFRDGDPAVFEISAVGRVSSWKMITAGREILANGAFVSKYRDFFKRVHLLRLRQIVTDHF